MDTTWGRESSVVSASEVESVVSVGLEVDEGAETEGRLEVSWAFSMMGVRMSE